MTFDSLGLQPAYLRAVAEEGYTEPTPVQRQAIPLVLAGRDVLAGAQTGTGKTAAFVLPLLQRLAATDPLDGLALAARAQRPKPAVRALVLTPTRELALQVEESVRTYGRHRPVRSVAIYGGVGFEPQARALRVGAPIVVATPGRLLDHLGQRTIDLSRVEVLVLDEADRMLDMGFIRDIRRVLEALPTRRQTLLFSATFSDAIRELAEGLLVNPASVDVSPRNTPTELVEQVVIPVDRERKRHLLTHLVASGRVSQALVFTRTKHGANRLAEQLGRDGIAAAAIHGNKSQGQRIRALDDFKSGRVGILVATDIAARGIDIEALPHVVNFELPMVAADYVHRIGRTGRAGVDGQAISLVCVDEAELLRDIQRLLRRPLPSETVAGFEPDRSIPAEPILAGRGGQARGGRGANAGRGTNPGRSANGSAGRGANAARPANPVRSRGDAGRSGHPGRGAEPLGGAMQRISDPARSAAPRAGESRRGATAGRSANTQRPTSSHPLTTLPGERLRRAEATPASRAHIGQRTGDTWSRKGNR